MVKNESWHTEPSALARPLLPKLWRVFCFREQSQDTGLQFSSYCWATRVSEPSAPWQPFHVLASLSPLTQMCKVLLGTPWSALLGPSAYVYPSPFQFVGIIFVTHCPPGHSPEVRDSHHCFSFPTPAIIMGMRILVGGPPALSLFIQSHAFCHNLPVTISLKFGNVEMQNLVHRLIYLSTY